MGNKRALMFLAAAALLAVGVSCGHGRTHAPSAPLTPPNPSGQSIQDITRNIDAAPAPKGVSAETWAALTAELKRLLVARAGGSKTISIAPIGSQNAVADLSAVSNAAGTQATLSWTEALPGDCDNDGQVDIADLQPIALHYGETSSGPGSPAFLADADGDGTVGISDLQPVANNYMAHLQGYQVWRGHWNGTSTDWEATLRPNTNAANPDWSADRPSPPPVSTRPTYVYQDDLTGVTDTANARYKVVAFGDGASGAASNEAPLTVNPLADSPWPKFRGNMQNTGQSPYVGAQTNTVKWSFLTGNSISLASPSIGLDGSVYIGSDDGYLYALNPSDGSLKWKTQIGAWRSCAAVGADGTVFLGGADGYVHALNPLDGSEKWKTMLAINGAQCSPAIGTDGTVYAGCAVSLASTDTFFALNPGDGSVKWKRAIGQVVISSPAIGSDGTIYVGAGDLYALNPADGGTKWSHTTGNGVYGAPALGDDGTVYVAASDGTVQALRPSDGSAKWTCLTSGNVTSSPGIGADGTLYVGSWSLKVYAISAADGSVKWTYDTTGEVESSPAVGADGTVYIAGGDMYALAPDGSLKWGQYGFFAGTVSSPAIAADGTIYVGCNDDYVYAISP